MSIHVIIDGYNLIRQSESFSELDRQDIQLGREALIEALAAYRRIKGHRITIVFDGIDAVGFSRRSEKRKGIDIRFSRYGETADTVIKRMAARQNERALVVSSDREVADSARAHGATAVDSRNFEARILMARYGDTAEDEDNEPTGWRPGTKKRGPSHRLSRKMRRQKEKFKSSETKDGRAFFSCGQDRIWIRQKV